MGEHNQRFNSFTEWCNKASSWLTRHPHYHKSRFRAACYDAQGRRCMIGGAFQRAHDEGAFPVRWFWPDQEVERMAFLAETGRLGSAPSPSRAEGA